MEAALLEATVSTKAEGDGQDGVHSGVGCKNPGEEGCSWPTYSMTDADGVVHICTVRAHKRLAVYYYSSAYKPYNSNAPTRKLLVSTSHTAHIRGFSLCKH